MFKRVEKKRKKLEEEEELGIDEDMKGFMGFNDTDSDESASDSDSGSDKHSDADQFQSDEEDLEEAGYEDGDEMEEDDASDDEEETPILLSEALRDPIYIVSLDPDVRACILCKGKVIKGTQMSTVHKASTAHVRRFERFKTFAAKSDPQSDAWKIARTVQKEASKPTGTQNRPDTGLSKRSLKRSAKQASIKEKRILHNKLRAKAKAKKATEKVSSSQDAAGKESSASKTLEKQKSQKAGAATGDKKLVKKGEQKATVEKSDASLSDKRTVKKRERKPPVSELQNVEKSDSSPQKLSEPQKKKRKVQKDQVATPSAPPQSPKRSQEKPLRKPKTFRQKERTTARAS